MSINKSRENLIRGYVAVGEESVRQRKSAKESFDFGNANDPEGTNVWLPEDVLPGFRVFMEDFYQACLPMRNSYLTKLLISNGWLI